MASKRVLIALFSNKFDIDAFHVSEVPDVAMLNPGQFPSEGGTVLYYTILASSDNPSLAKFHIIPLTPDPIRFIFLPRAPFQAPNEVKIPKYEILPYGSKSFDHQALYCVVALASEVPGKSKYVFVIPFKGQSCDEVLTNTPVAPVFKKANGASNTENLGYTIKQDFNDSMTVTLKPVNAMEYQ